MPENKRPVSISLAAILLLLIAFNGFQDLLGRTDAMTAAKWFSEASFRNLFNAGFTLVSAVAATLTAIALWEMKGWAILSYAVWAGFLAAGLLLHEVLMKIQGMSHAPWWQVAIGPVLLAGILGLIGLALRGSLKAAAR